MSLTSSLRRYFFSNIKNKKQIQVYKQNLIDVSIVVDSPKKNNLKVIYVEGYSTNIMGLALALVKNKFI